MRMVEKRKTKNQYVMFLTEVLSKWASTEGRLIQLTSKTGGKISRV